MDGYISIYIYIGDTNSKHLKSFKIFKSQLKFSVIPMEQSDESGACVDLVSQRRF